MPEQTGDDFGEEVVEHVLHHFEGEAMRSGPGPKDRDRLLRAFLCGMSAVVNAVLEEPGLLTTHIESINRAINARVSRLRD